MIVPFYKSSSHDFNLLLGDTFELLPQFNFKFDMVFADPPYFLSNDGISCQAGKIVSVNKGEWDKGGTPEQINEFNNRWIGLCREKLDMGKDQSATKHIMSLFYIFNRIHNLGSEVSKETTSIQL